MENEQNVKKRSWLKVPHTYTIIFAIIFLAGIASYIIPAGEFDRVEDEEGRMLVVDGSYHHIESDPVSFFEMFTAIPMGLEKGAQIIFYIFLVSGVFGIIRSTGAIEAGVYKGVKALEGREKLLIPLSMILFSVGGFTMGMAEETIIFVPIGVAIARAMGFDAVTGTAMITLGAASGFFGGMLNPFTVGVAQSLADVPLFSGIGFRAVVYIFVLGFAIFYVSRYAFKVKKNPQASVIYDIEQKAKSTVSEIDIPTLTGKHKFVFIVMACGIGFNIYGVFNWGWFLTQLTASFLIMGLIAGLIGGLKPATIFDSFIDGAKAVTFGALIVGFARAITVVLEQGKIIDTIVYAASETIGHLPHAISAIGMLFIQALLNLFISSGSGQAAATMPIMIPITDLLGLERQVAVLAFQYGDSLTNSIIPTSSALMAYLAVAGIPYEKWIKFIWKMILGWAVIACLALIAAVAIGIT
ncbi:AbgT family transporter [Lysinibacillus irui]|uniref:AbgT family transporter n=1 Tax=Lysinibacillus irui TaxID=2998077 RepID=A0AAJ5RHW9_9BACI|nr:MULTISPECIES: AbgT family transporter [Lysinibacillus]MEA0555063.1 AbgT family transporter [Lysinibacillus irui]MEA0565614.1 AbgT family transporter [Lysinibacillus irui]MEA0976778.1 AbgT family transporter [Lysinibacillus irui]MEA1042932.1 AbgT family transporter [Lysinibacillus irui]WDV05693.1 AbgT family transporter [Lysinibacillus irui]